MESPCEHGAVFGYFSKTDSKVPQQQVEEDCKHTWRDEASAVINDVRDHVKHASISSRLESSDATIHLNLTTAEDQELTVRLTYQGFAIVCRGQHDKVEIEQDSLEHHETLYALLNTVSRGYCESFGKSLQEKLQLLQASE